MKTKERSDSYYYKKYNLTEEQLNELKAKKNSIGDPDLIIEDLIDVAPVLTLSLSQKVEYLKSLRGKVVKILYLIENEIKDSQTSAGPYIQMLLFDISQANLLFQDRLTDISIKLFGIGNTYKDTPYETVRKQILDTRGLIDKLITEFSSSKEKK